MVILLNLFKHLLQYTVIAPEFQGFCLSETPKIIKMWAIFLETYLTCMNKLAILKLQDKVV